MRRGSRFACFAMVCSLTACVSGHVNGWDEHYDDSARPPEETPVVDASSEVDEGTALPGDEGAHDASVPENDAGPQEPVVPCGKATDDARAALEKHCSSCHGPESPGEGGFDSVLQFSSLVAEGYLVPDQPLRSPIYLRMAERSMPPEGRPQLSDEEISMVYAWISCGAAAFPQP